METGKKVVLLGQFGVGKTSLMRRFLKDEFKTDYRPTLGVQIKKKVIMLPSGRKISMIVWDLEGFSSVSKTRASYLMGSNSFIYVFDLTRPVTYHRLDEEISYILANYPNVILKIIGNKADLNDSAKTIAEDLMRKSIKIHSFVSAKTGEGVHELFLDIAKKLKHD